MDNNFVVCQYCRAGNLLGREKCGICGGELNSTAGEEVRQIKDINLEDMLKFDPIPKELMIILAINYFGAFISFLFTIPFLLETFLLWLLIPIVFGIPVYILYSIQQGSNFARITYIILGILSILLLIGEHQYLALIPVIIEVGILAFDPKIINYCQF